MNFLKICQRCKNSDCCTIPFYAFATENERNRILEYLKAKEIHIKEKNIFQIHTNNESNGLKTYLISKKKTGKCIFLKKDKSCLIQEVKPIDCLNWPLTYDYIQDSNELIIYLFNCLFSKTLKKLNKLNKWVELQKTELIKNLTNYSIDELVAYSSLPAISNYKVLFRESFFLKERTEVSLIEQ